MALENENHKAHSQEIEIKTTSVCYTALYDLTCHVLSFQVTGSWPQAKVRHTESVAFETYVLAS